MLTDITVTPWALIAYLDPGTGSILLTMVAGVLGSILMFGKTLLAWITAPFTRLARRKPSSSNAAPTDPDNG